MQPSPPSPEERAAARAELGPAVAERNELRARREARYKAILDADAEYQSLQAAQKIAAERVAKLHSITGRYKITVGTIIAGLMFSVKAEGDSWEEVIAKLPRQNSVA